MCISQSPLRLLDCLLYFVHCFNCNCKCMLWFEFFFCFKIFKPDKFSFSFALDLGNESETKGNKITLV